MTSNYLDKIGVVPGRNAVAVSPSSLIHTGVRLIMYVSNSLVTILTASPLSVDLNTCHNITTFTSRRFILLLDAIPQNCHYLWMNLPRLLPPPSEIPCL
uniref:Uncharacterized protein n=1 Tax=Trichobilharzia regenti TaxID=157069 RepID=A0AA85J5J9_TRIRE|nr:unnamed protein product [Trichobilharzia regenti]CAH8820667.1 unnamed protein product [Trichobilharzia regenti]